MKTFFLRKQEKQVENKSFIEILDNNDITKIKDEQLIFIKGGDGDNEEYSDLDLE